MADRTIILSGTMTYHALFQTQTGSLENLVRQSLEDNGWSIADVSIDSAWLSNTLSVTIAVNAVCDAISTFVRTGVISTLVNVNDAGDFLFQDVSLNIVHDTGDCSQAQPVLDSPPDSNPPPQPPQQASPPPKTIERGILATVTVSASDPANSPPPMPKLPSKDFIQQLADDFKVSRQTILYGGTMIFLLILLKK